MFQLHVRAVTTSLCGEPNKNLTCKIKASPAVPEYLNMKADEKCPGKSGVSLPCEEVTFLKQHSLNLILCTGFGRRERERGEIVFERLAETEGESL